MLAAVLALGSSLAWGLSDFVGGLRSRTLPRLGVLLVTQLTSLVLLVVATAVGGQPPPSAVPLLAGGAAGVGEALGTAALYRGLSSGKMALVTPVAALAPAVPVVVGTLRGEVPGPLRLVGLVLAVTGVVVVSRSVPPSGDAPTAGRWSAVGFGLLAAVGFGTAFVGTDLAADVDVVWALLSARVVAVLVFLVAAGLTRAPVRMAPRHLPLLVGAGVLMLTADALYAVASTQGLLPVVAVLGSLFPVVTIVLARLVLSERMSRLQLVGVAVCLVATVVLVV